MSIENPETFQSNLNLSLSFLKSHKDLTDPAETAFLELASSVQQRIKDNMVNFKVASDKLNDQLNIFELKVQSIVRSYETKIKAHDKIRATQSEQDCAGLAEDRKLAANECMKELSGIDNDVYFLETPIRTFLDSITAKLYVKQPGTLPIGKTSADSNFVPHDRVDKQRRWLSHAVQMRTTGQIDKLVQNASVYGSNGQRTLIVKSEEI